MFLNGFLLKSYQLLFFLFNVLGRLVSHERLSCFAVSELRFVISKQSV